MAKRMTQANRLQAYMRACKHQVLLLTGWSEQKYGEHMYDCGLQWLRYTLQGDAHAVDQLIQSGAFWGMWKLNWYQREQDFLAAVEKYGWGLHQRRYAYRNINDVKLLGDGGNYYGKALEDSYCRDVVSRLKG